VTEGSDADEARPNLKVRPSRIPFGEPDLQVRLDGSSVGASTAGSEDPAYICTFPAPR
jgi:hypothetical protein